MIEIKHKHGVIIMPNEDEVIMNSLEGPVFVKEYDKARLPSRS